MARETWPFKHMISIKEESSIIRQIRETTGLSIFDSRKMFAMIVAKVALEENNLKLALQTMIDLHLTDLDLGLNNDDVTKLLNTPLREDGRSIRNAIKSSIQPKEKVVDLKMISKTLFPEATFCDGYTANGLSSNTKPSNCEILGHFDDNGFKGLREHYLVKMEDNLMVHLRICEASPGSGYEAFAAILKAGDGAEERFKNMKSCFAK